MATFEVKYNKLDNYAKDIRSMVSTLKRLDQDIDSCRSKISTSVSSANYSVRNTLSRISNSFMDDIKAMEKMAQVLDSAHDLYKTTEKNITKIKVKIKEPERAEDGASAVWDSIVDVITGIPEEMGIIGGTLSFFGDLFTGDHDNVDIILEFGKWLAKSTGAVLGEISKNAPDWISVLTGYSDDVFKSVKDYLTHLVDDFVVGASKTVSKVGSVIANWAAVIVEGAINFKGNLDEFGEGAMAKLRFWGETVTETVIDVGKIALVSIGIVAVAAAAGVTAPAWAVGLGAGAVVAIGDGVFEAIFGGDMTEWATDGFMDFLGID